MCTKKFFLKGTSKNSDLLRTNPDLIGFGESKRDKISITRSLLKIVILLFSINLFGCAAMTQRVSLAGIEATPATKGKSFVTCYFPFSPFSIFPIITLYEEGMQYVAKGPDNCRHAFAKRIKTTTSEAFLMPQFWKKSIYRDVDLALKKRKLTLKPRG